MPFMLTKEDFFIPGLGMNLVRILPSWRGEGEDFYLEVPTHYQVSLNTRAAICASMANRPCLLCESGNPQVMRFMMNVSIRTRQDRLKVLVWSVSASTMQAILEWVVKHELDISDVRGGRALRVYKTSHDPKDPLKLILGVKAQKVSMEKVQPKLYDLDKHMVPPTDEEMRLMLQGFA